MANNVLFIACDDLNTWATLKGMYPGLVQTPNLDALQSRGVNFSNAFCQTALCNPSRTSLLTGQTPIATGVLDNAITWTEAVPVSKTIFDVMQGQGYLTAHTGKIFHTPYIVDPIRSELFDRYFLNTNNWHTDFGLPFGAGPGPFAETEHGDHINAAWMADQIRGYTGTKPFFMAYGAFKPHAPFVVPQEFFDLYPLSKIPLPAVLEGDSSDVPPFMREQILEWFHTDILNADYWKKFVQAYLACISFMDEQIGHLLDALRDSGHDDDTAIVLFGDNGYHFGEKHQWHKFTLWGEAARVPLIIVDPSAAANATRGTKIDRPVELIDLMPTILDWALEGTGKTPAAVAPWLEGDSLKSLIRGATPTDDGVAVTLMYGSAAVTAEIGDLTYRYIRYADGSEELYDVSAGHDVREWDNLLVPAPDSAIAAVRTTMLAKLNDYASEHHLYLSNSGGTTVTGSSGRDLLVGGHATTLAGGTGDDVYHIVNASANISETATGGIDTVYASVSYALPTYVENGIAHMRGGGVTLTGNGLDNRLTSDLTADTIYGGDGKDLIRGLSNRDRLYGEAGSDTIDGGSDDDVIVGGTDADSLTGGDGADRFVFLPGESGVDIITDFSGPGGDKIDLSAFTSGSTVTYTGGSGGTLRVSGVDIVKVFGAFDPSRDVIAPAGTEPPPPPPGSGETWTGTAGADNHTGTAYADSLTGLAGNDTLTGLAGNDTIKGGNGDDIIAGGDGDDFLSGNGGADAITDGAGLDSLYGGTEADRYVFTPNDGKLDTVWDFTASEGDKIDLGQFTGITQADVAFADGILSVKGEQVVKIVGAFDPSRDVILPSGTQPPPPPPPGSGETWTGTMGADTRTGTAYSDSYLGAGGNDTLYGEAGNDTLKGGNGDDWLYGGDGNDFISGNAGADRLFDGAGIDSLYGGSEPDAFNMAKGDAALDTIWDFSGAAGDRIVLGAFSGITMADVSFADGILTVGGEQVVRIVGDFSVGSHVLLH